MDSNEREYTYKPSERLKTSYKAKHFSDSSNLDVFISDGSFSQSHSQSESLLVDQDEVFNDNLNQVEQQLHDGSHSDKQHYDNYYDSFINQSELEDSSASPGKRFVSLLVTFVMAFGLAFLIRTYVFEPYKVPTGSMLQTIQLDNYLIGDKLALHFSEPHPQEIVTFIDPVEPNKTLIKRIIANEGSVVDLKDGKVYVDGKAQDEPYVNGQPSEPISDKWGSNLTGPIIYPYTVPKGCVWVMGDNRGNSLDSRYFGAVKKNTITSIARCIVWPPKDVKML